MMKKFYQITGLIGIIGIIAALLGWANDGVNPVFDNHNRFTFETSGSTVHKRELTTSPNFDQIIVQTDNSDIYLHSGKKYQITVTGLNPNAVKAKVRKKRLEINESRPVAINWRNDCSRIDITIPKNKYLAEVDSSSDNGNLNIKSISINDLFANAQNGKVTVDKLTAKKTIFASYGNHRIDIGNSDIGKSLITIHGGQLKIDHSKLTADAKAYSSQVAITDSQLINRNSFQMLRKGDFTIKAAPNLSYELAAVGPNIRYEGQKINNKLTKKLSAKNSLEVFAAKGTITVE